MRRFALLVLLLSCAACARKAQPVADGGAPDLPVVLPPGADAPPPMEVKPKKALDPQSFAGKSLAQWREDLRSKDRHKIVAAMKACEALGPLAVDALPDILAADIDKPKWDPNFGDRTPESHSYYEFQAMKAEVWPAVAKAFGKKAVPHLLPMLDVPDKELKNAAREKAFSAGRAMFALRAIGPDAADAIPKLTELVGHTKSGMRDTAARALLDIAGTDKRAVPGLLLALKSDRWVRPRAIDALSRLDPEGTAEACLASVAAGGRLDHEAMPSEVFVRFGPKGVALAIARSKRANGAFDSGYSQLVFSYTPPELLAPHTAEIVKWFDTAVQEKNTYSYCQLLGKIGPPAKAAVPRLLELAKGGDVQALAAAARTGATWQQVSEVLWERKDRTMVTATEVLPAFGPQIKGELAPFVEMLKTGTPEEKTRLAGAILQCAPENARALEVIVAEQLESDRIEREEEGALASDYYSNVPKTAVAAMRAHLKHANARVRYHAARRLLSCEPEKPDPDAIRVVANHIISNPDSTFDPQRFTLLANAGDAGIVALGELLTNKTAKIEHYSIEQYAATALANAGERAAPAAPALRKCLETEQNPNVIGFAARALGNVSSPKKPLALEPARKHLGAGERWLRFCAAEAVLKCDPANEEALKTLAELVKPGAGAHHAESRQYHLPFGIRGEAVPLLFRLDPERAIRADAFRDLWFPNSLDQ